MKPPEDSTWLKEVLLKLKLEDEVRFRTCKEAILKSVERLREEKDYTGILEEIRQTIDEFRSYQAVALLILTSADSLQKEQETGIADKISEEEVAEMVAELELDEKHRKRDEVLTALRIRKHTSGTRETKKIYANSPKKIYVGGLNYDCKEAELKTLCEQFGTVVEVNLVKDTKTGESRGFGFVLFEEEATAIKAIENLSMTTFQGRHLKVGHAASKKSLS